MGTTSRLSSDSSEPAADEPVEAPALGALCVGSGETVRKWVRQAQVDAGARPGTTTEESAEVRRLKRENAELKRANAILKAAAAFFGAELDRPSR